MYVAEEEPINVDQDRYKPVAKVHWRKETIVSRSTDGVGRIGLMHEQSQEVRLEYSSGASL